MKYSANSWQDFSLKKDIEKMLKAMNKYNSVVIALLLEIALVVLGVLVDRLFDIIPQWLTTAYFICLGLIIVLPLFVLLISKIIACYKNKFFPIASIPAKEMIDTFDNEISYFVMMSDSFVELYNNAKSNQSANLAKFYYIEMCFYRNKAIDKLSGFTNVKNVFKVDLDGKDASKKVHIARLVNICALLDEIAKIIIDNEVELSLKFEKSIIATNMIHSGKLIRFKEKIRRDFCLTTNDLK